MRQSRRPGRWRQLGPAGVLGSLVAFAVVALVLGSGPDLVVPTGLARAGGRLYFTIYSPPSVDQVTYTYRAGALHFGVPQVIARPAGADGVLFGPDGRLLVGGQVTGHVYAIAPGSDSVKAIPAGVTGAFHLALDPAGTVLYTSAEPGPLAAVPLTAGAIGHVIALHGADTSVTALAFGPGRQVLYTTGKPDGKGDIGLVDLATGATRRLFTGVVGAHGAIYDPYSRSYLVVGGDIVLQLPASDPSTVISELTIPGVVLDQGAVTGRGQALLASNTGQAVLIDYAATGRIGDVADRVITKPLVAHLDDMAPLIGPGARPLATSAPTWRAAGGSALGAAVAGGAGLAAWWARRRRRDRPPSRRLPRWDRRRQRKSGGYDDGSFGPLTGP